MLSRALSKVDIVIEESNGKFILKMMNNIRFGTFRLKENAEKFREFLKRNPQYIVTNPVERKSCSDLRIRLSDKSQPHFGRFKDTHIGLVRKFLRDHIINSESADDGKHSSGGGAQKRTNTSSGGGGGGDSGVLKLTSSGGKRTSASGGGRGAQKRTNTGSEDSGSGGGGEQIFDIRVSQDKKPQRGRQQQQGFLPQYFRGLFDPSEQFQERPHNKQTAQKHKQGGDDRYFF